MSASRSETETRVCFCGHSERWHSHDGVGDCEHDEGCTCQAFGGSYGGPLAHIEACLTRIPCQGSTLEDCDAVIATHRIHRDRHQPLPRSEWCDRCEALAAVRAALSPFPPTPEGAED